MGTRPLNKGTSRPITLCTVKLFIQLRYNKNDHLTKWSIFVRFLSIFHTHAQKENRKVSKMKGNYILNILALLLFENLQRIY